MDTEFDVEELIKKSHESKQYSHSPYSKFRVGAALLDAQGRIWTGCNVENCAYPAGICAERTAYCKAVSEGARQFKAIAISSDMELDFIYPCGICRQFMAEFGTDITVIVTRSAKSSNETYRIFKLKDLLPNAFVPDHLDKRRIPN